MSPSGLIDSHYLAIVGPTGSGKSALGISIAEKIGGEIVNCDSVQVYRGFNIGSAKVTAPEMRGVPHHLIDILEWNEDCDASRYAKMAQAAIADISGRGKIPIIVGGTGLYLRALWGYDWDDQISSDPKVRSNLARLETAEAFDDLKNLDPRRAAQIHCNDRFRILRALEIIQVTGKPASEQLQGSKPQSPPLFSIFLNPDRAELHQILENRVEMMLKRGLVDEVKNLLASGVLSTAKAMTSIGYKQVIQFLEGGNSFAELKERILIATRQYAKRQCTWFRGMDWTMEIREFGRELSAMTEPLEENIQEVLEKGAT